ncbi:helix-turn-helix domain-containing protein [Streptomyces sp. NPDC014779]|uniref:helix-turn-helix domain-containing protein n=1 Tax=Streptomyces sp. NPDC014779 TaxID=3364911 RepID=UPI0036FD2420
MRREQPPWVHEQRQTLGRRIRDLRVHRGHTQEAFAEMSNIDRRTFQRIEAGTSDPRYGDLLQIAVALRVSLDELLR